MFVEVPLGLDQRLHGGIKLAYNVWANAHIEVKFYTTITFRCFKGSKMGLSPYASFMLPCSS